MLRDGGDPAGGGPAREEIVVESRGPGAGGVSAAPAATAAATADLTPGRVLALLGADAASEALRRNRAAAASHAALLEDRRLRIAEERARRAVRSAEQAALDVFLQGS